MMRKLTREVALVTGGSCSIGAAIAKRLAVQPAKARQVTSAATPQRGVDGAGEA
jgi:NAD(P)-dependent dehydrogenase (short-subunit alcohol dehydrogenase family)